MCGNFGEQRFAAHDRSRIALAAWVVLGWGC
jgi:hypothetical protein